MWSQTAAFLGRLTALAFGITVSSFATYILWQSLGTPLDCGLGYVRPAVDFALPTAALGLLIGSGLATSGILGARLSRAGYRWWSVGVSAGLEFMFTVVTVFAVMAVQFGHVCYASPSL